MLAHPAKPWLISTDLAMGGMVWAQMSPRNQTRSLRRSQQNVINPANPGGALNDSVEHRLHVGGRSADDAKHLSGRGLMLQRLAQFCVALTKFPKEPNVLNSNHCLIGESLEKRDLLVGKRPHFRATDHDGADGDTFAQ